MQRPVQSQLSKREFVLEQSPVRSQRSVVHLISPVLVQELPILQIIPNELSKLQLHGTIKVPMYITQQRRNAMGVGLMMEADLDTTEHASHWILQGVALVQNIE